MVPEDNPFEALEEHNSTSTVPDVELTRIGLTDAAKALGDAKVQAYIEANFGIQALKAVRAFLPMLAGLL